MEDTYSIDREKMYVRIGDTGEWQEWDAKDALDQYHRKRMDLAGQHEVAQASFSIMVKHRLWNKALETRKRLDTVTQARQKWDADAINLETLYDRAEGGQIRRTASSNQWRSREQGEQLRWGQPTLLAGHSMLPIALRASRHPSPHPSSITARTLLNRVPTEVSHNNGWHSAEAPLIMHWADLDCTEQICEPISNTQTVQDILRALSSTVLGEDHPVILRKGSLSDSEADALERLINSGGRQYDKPPRLEDVLKTTGYPFFGVEVYQAPFNDSSKVTSTFHPGGVDWIIGWAESELNCTQQEWSQRQSHGTRNRPRLTLAVKISSLSPPSVDVTPAGPV